MTDGMLTLSLKAAGSRSIAASNQTPESLTLRSSSHVLSNGHGTSTPTAKQSASQSVNRVEADAVDTHLADDAAFVLGQENRLVAHALGLLDDLDHGSVDQGATHADSVGNPTVENQLALSIAVFPLSIYGPSGNGKTQLLHAIAALWTRGDDRGNCLLTSASDFAQAYANAVKADDIARFQRRYQRLPLLLIDEADGLRKKPGAQHQLSTILDHRQKQQRPTVLTFLQNPNSSRLTTRLASRIATGICLPLELPDATTRQQLVRQFCRQRNLQLSESDIVAISERPATSVPQLMGLIQQLCVATTGSGSENSPSSDKLTELLNTSTPAIDPKQVMRASAHFFGVNPKNLVSKSRRKLDVLARSVAMYMIRTNSTLSFQQIGNLFGKRDHTTVMHACKKVALDRQTDPVTRNAINDIQRRIIEHQPKTNTRRRVRSGA